VLQTNLNFRTVEPHLALLIKRGLLEGIPHGKRASYRTSPKDKETLEKLKKLWGLFGSSTRD
jgi:predicted transcriptional regulator